MFKSNHKRLPDNPNIKMHWEPCYNGYELMTGIGPFIEQNLAKIDQVMTWARQQSSKLYAVRLDLRFPQHYEQSGLGDFSNQPTQRFFKSLQKRLDRYHQEGLLLELRRHEDRMAYLWSREYDKGYSRPHFHILLLFNGHAFRSVGHISSGGSSLYRMIEESWLSALRCQGFGRDNLVHLCEAGQYRLDRDDLAGFSRLFHRVSYMAKVRDKGFDDGYHRFGGSRL